MHGSEDAAEFTAPAHSCSHPDAKCNLGFVDLEPSVSFTKRRDGPARSSFSIRITPKRNMSLAKMPFDRGQMKEVIEHLEAAARPTRHAGYIPHQLPAAYRKEFRIADADRELKLHKKSGRNRTVPQPAKRP